MTNPHWPLDQDNDPGDCNDRTAIVARRIYARALELFHEYGGKYNEWTCVQIATFEDVLMYGDSASAAEPIGILRSR